MCAVCIPEVSPGPATRFGTTLSHPCVPRFQLIPASSVVCESRFHRDVAQSLLYPEERRARAVYYPLRKLHHSVILTAKPFRIRSYEKRPFNSFRIRSYKNVGLKVPCFHTLTKNIGGRGSPCAWPEGCRDTADSGCFRLSTANFPPLPHLPHSFPTLLQSAT